MNRNTGSGGNIVKRNRKSIKLLYDSWNVEQAYIRTLGLNRIKRCPPVPLRIVNRQNINITTTKPTSHNTFRIYIVNSVQKLHFTHVPTMKLSSTPPTRLLITTNRHGTQGSKGHIFNSQASPTAPTSLRRATDELSSISRLTTRKPHRVRSTTYTTSDASI